jgi:hypothetical protein
MLYNSGMLPMQPFDIVMETALLMANQHGITGDIQLTIDAPDVPIVVYIKNTGYAFIKTQSDIILNDTCQLVMNNVSELVRVHNNYV